MGTKVVATQMSTNYHIVFEVREKAIALQIVFKEQTLLRWDADIICINLS